MVAAQGSGLVPIVLKRRRREDVARATVRTRRVERRGRVAELQLWRCQQQLSPTLVKAGPSEAKRFRGIFQGRRLNRPREPLPN